MTPMIHLHWSLSLGGTIARVSRLRYAAGVARMKLCSHEALDSMGHASAVECRERS
jgi:hypothetical protein